MNMQRSEPAEMSVSEFSSRLENYLKRVPALANIAIRGEVTGWNPQPNGSVYFALKDANATLNCYAFASDARKFPKLENGVAVLAIGSIELRQNRSGYQLLSREVRITGEGESYARYQALLKRFKDEGFFDEGRKRKIPNFPRKVALIAGPDAADDFKSIVRREAPTVEIISIPSKVQGFGAEIELASAIDTAARVGADVVVLTRGGGSFEDMQPFNTEVIVRAIWASKLPVLTALGHTKNRNLADFVADVSVITPTQAGHAVAESWVKAGRDLRDAIRRLNDRMRTIVLRATQSYDMTVTRLENRRDRVISQLRERLGKVERRLAHQSPAAKVGQRSAQVTHLNARMDIARKDRVRRLQDRLDAVRVAVNSKPREIVTRLDHRLQLATTALVAHDPERPLRDGYALLMKDGHVVQSSADLSPGDSVTAKLKRGAIRARVEERIDESTTG